jgi:hypothetical protein
LNKAYKLKCSLIHFSLLYESLEEKEIKGFTPGGMFNSVPVGNSLEML